MPAWWLMLHLCKMTFNPLKSLKGRGRQNRKICETNMKKLTGEQPSGYHVQSAGLSLCKPSQNLLKVSGPAGWINKMSNMIWSHLSKTALIVPLCNPKPEKKELLSLVFILRPNLKVSSPSHRWLAARPAFTIRSVEPTRWTFFFFFFCVGKHNLSSQEKKKKKHETRPSNFSHCQLTLCVLRCADSRELLVLINADIVPREK